MKNFGLIGHPIENSKSPELFRKFTNSQYSYDLIKGDKFEKVYSIFLERYDGVNVTCPFKTLAYRKISDVSQNCQIIQACNTLIKTQHSIKGYNTDVFGVQQALLEAGAVDFSEISVRPHIALVVGAGGAGRAATLALSRMGYEVFIANRTLSSANEFGSNLMTRVSVVPLKDIPFIVEKCDILVYTLPVEIKEMFQIPLLEEKSPKPRKILFLEANYVSPLVNSSFLKKYPMFEENFKYVSGLRWLYFQAQQSCSLFVNEFH